MTPLQNFHVDVRTSGWCCVFDTQLALSRYGLALALRLSEQMEVWQCRAFWQMLDDSDYYLSSNVRTLRKGGTNELPVFSQAAAKLDQPGEILDEWQTARFQPDLMGRLCWLGYTLEESMIPSEIDSQLDQRFDILARTLEERWADGNPKSDLGEIHHECARDAVALTAALIRYKPFILTLYQADNKKKGELQEPEICEYLRNCGIRCLNANTDGKIKTMQSYLLQLLTNTGALELVYASGINLAALHVITPKAYVMSPRGEDEEVAAQLLPIKTAQSKSEAFPGWSGCTAFWYPLWQ